MAQETPAASKVNFFLTRINDNVIRPLMRIFLADHLHVAYFSSQVDLELVPGVNTCMLNDRRFCLIIEYRTLSLRAISHTLSPCFAITLRVHVQVLPFNFQKVYRSRYRLRGSCFRIENIYFLFYKRSYYKDKRYKT